MPLMDAEVLAGQMVEILTAEQAAAAGVTEPGAVYVRSQHGGVIALAARADHPEQVARRAVTDGIQSAQAALELPGPAIKDADVLSTLIPSLADRLGRISGPVQRGLLTLMPSYDDDGKRIPADRRLTRSTLARSGAETEGELARLIVDASRAIALLHAARRR